MVLVRIGWCATTEAFQVIVCAIQLGLPWAVPCNIPLRPLTPGVNMRGWSWSAASNNQTVARRSRKVC